MVRDRTTGRFVYTERLERRFGETSWAYIRRSVRREGQIRAHFNESRMEVLVGWGTGSVEEFIEAYPEYGPIDKTAEGKPGGDPAGGPGDGRLEGERVDR